MVLKPQSSRCICTPFPVPWLMLACRSSCSRAFALRAHAVSGKDIYRGLLPFEALQSQVQSLFAAAVNQSPQSSVSWRVELPVRPPTCSDLPIWKWREIVANRSDHSSSQNAPTLNRIIVCIDWLEASQSSCFGFNLCIVTRTFRFNIRGGARLTQAAYQMQSHCFVYSDSVTLLSF